MPLKKVTEKKEDKKTILSRVSQFNLSDKLGKINVYLATIFLVTWIVIGLFLLLLIGQSFKQGLFSGLLNQKGPSPTQESQQPTEADLPGVGRVNIACTQKALSNEAIQKIVQSGNISGLTDEEKTNFEPCIVQKEEATPSASPTQ